MYLASETTVAPISPSSKMLLLAMEYFTSKKETLRRKNVFLALITSFFLGLIIFSKLINLQISTLYLIIIFALLAFFYFLTSNYLNHLIKSRLRIDNNYIERISGKNSETLLFSEVKAISIKRRSNGNIREISILFKDNKNLYINAFEEEFESLKEEILKNLDKK